jgi:hypothetical protein
MMIITGCPAHGCSRLRLATCGHPVIGGGTTGCTFGMQVTGDRTSVSMAGSITATGMAEKVMRAGIGREAISSTTEQ